MTQEETGGAAPTNQTMADLLSQEEYSYQRPKRGEIRVGTVVLVGPNEIVVDVGAKREGVLSSQDLQRLSAEERAAISVGDEVSVFIVNPEDRDGNTIVSLFLAQIEKDWQKAEEYNESKQIVEETVIGYNKGGLVVPFGKIRGFVPASQVVGFPRRLSPSQKNERLAQQVGRKLAVQIIEVDRRRKRLIMSEQAAQSEWREQQRRKLMDNLVEGQVVRGVVTSLANFGAFVDLGGTDGLIHISELAWHRVRHPREVVQVGEEVDVYVLKLDRVNSKIGLSLRRLLPDPWSLVDTKYFIDQHVVGKITNVTDFGAFAHLEDGIEGLIHISELSDTEVNHPGEVVKRGERYLLEIIKIEPERQRIGLSLKRVSSEEQDVWRASQETSARPETAEPSLSAEPTGAVEEETETDAIAEDESPQDTATAPEPELAEALTEAESSPSAEPTGAVEEETETDATAEDESPQDTATAPEPELAEALTEAESSPSAEPTGALEEETETDATAEDESPQDTATAPEHELAEALTEAESSPSAEPTAALEEETETDSAAEDQSPQGTATSPEPELVEAEELTENDTPPSEDETGPDEIPNDTSPAASEPHPETLAQEPVA